jgi:hypothetical protein
VPCAGCLVRLCNRGRHRGARFPSRPPGSRRQLEEITPLSETVVFYPLHGELTAQLIRRAVSQGNIRRLEDGPFGGTRISLGETVEGEAIECPLPAEGPWQLVGIKDLRFFADRASKKWPLRGSLKESGVLVAYLA